jgi:ABC-type phosphate/phosphonate transport system substrate-binding protein/rhodanese-related sulfurtransferase
MYRGIRCARATAFAVALILPGAVAASMTLTVAIEPLTETANQAFANDFLPLARQLSQTVGQPVTASLSRELAREIVATRSGSHDIIMGPAHVVGSAVRYGYVPLAALPGEVTVAFVTRPQSGIRELEQLRGKKLGLPSVESLASFVALGEMNARKLLAKDAGVSVVHYRHHDVALYALEQGFVDAVAIDGELAKAAVREKGMVVYFESPAIRRFNVAVNAQLPPDVQARLRDAFLNPRTQLAVRGEGNAAPAGFKPIAAAEFGYVNKLTYLTPSFLPGATVIGADKVVELMASGVPCYDVRTEAEYKAHHIAGAKFLPYAEHSKKEVGFDRTQDKFGLLDSVKDRNAPIIFACNGEECWKSYKASTFALAEGFRNVYWFRGGFPEWRNRRFALERAL